MRFWLHRISHLDFISYPLLENGYLSIGFSDFSNEKFLEKVSEKDWEYFENQIVDVWGEKFRSRYSLWNFIAEMSKGDWILTPHYNEFSVYEIVEENAILPSSFNMPKGFSDWNQRNIAFNNNGMFLVNGESEYLDIGFLRKVIPIQRNIPRYGYADSSLTARMKIRSANADISDLEKSIKNAIEFYRIKKPINLKSSLIDLSVNSWLENIRNELNPDKFEKLIGKYLDRVGATSTELNPGKNSKDKSGDVDVIGVFESIKTIVNVQVKYHIGETSDWAVQQINDYAKSALSVSDGYSRVYWVITSSDEYSKEAKQLAIKNGVLLFTGKQFVQMLMEAGIENFDEL